MMVALLITTIAFVALAALLGSALKTVSLEKNRNQGNEVATQAIEDLQRLDYNHLGVCTAAAGAPTGLTDPVYLANCTSPTYEVPCPSPGTGGTVPQTSYSCTYQHTTFQVTRYIAWSDSSHSAKRLAVLVKWTDRVGGHQVTEQSSVRSPDQGSVVGLSPPSITYTNVQVAGSSPCGATTVSLASGTTQCPITFTATASGAVDSVFANFLTLSGTTPVSSSLSLNELSVNGDGTTTWQVTLPASSPQFTFGAGTQYINFVADRSADGKVTSQPYSTVINFQCSSGCSASNPPSFSGLSIPATISVGTSGALCNDVNVSVNSSNLAASDLVTVNFQTLTGPESLALVQTSNNNWTGVIPKAAGYSFASGTQTMYVAGAQAYAPSASPAEYGSTTTAASSVTFGGAC